MKKIILAFCLIAVVITTSGCSLFNTTERQAETRGRKIIKAMNENDPDKIRTFFSQKAISESNDLEENINTICSSLENRVLDYKFEMGIESDDIEYGQKSKLICYNFNIYTDTETYVLFIIEYTTDTFKPENKGIYSITFEAQYDADNNVNFNYWQDRMIPGLHIY